MPQPTRSDVHVDSALTNISVAYMQDASNFIASKVFPQVPVNKASDKYYTYTKGDSRRNLVKPRAPGTESAGSGLTMGTDSYSCEIYAFHDDIADPDRDNADDGVDLEEDATRFVTELFMINQEVQWTSDFFTTGKWDTDVTGDTDFTYWSDGASDPETDIDTGKKTILKSTGRMPNTLVVSFEVHQALKKHPLVTERFKYTSPDSITEAMLARFFEIENYYVSKASYNTGNEGGTDVDAFIAGKHALLCYVTPRPGLRTPTAGYTFVWKGLTGANNVGVAISNFRMQHLKSDRIEGEYAYDNKVVSSDMGYFFSGAVA